jgi:hypothetical protein
MNGSGGYAGATLAFGLEEAARRELQQLRQEYPNWGFLVSHYLWLAIRGKNILISASTPGELRAALPPAPADPPVPHSVATTHPMAAIPARVAVPARHPRTDTRAAMGPSPALTRLGRSLWPWHRRSSRRA